MEASFFMGFSESVIQYIGRQLTDVCRIKEDFQ
ncbi:hypothetical protein BAMY6639_11370 [Bacillus amyloliquefaciens UMAF6639]|nr:hypothetical protein BAMY6639_11370 [Bacillus amyloliquefaciens UMAF6639]AMQ72536.1 hypothetical protein BAMY6614_03940 [Bacillus amyloliquefaciens UMAF6614]ERH55238.1 hypothetical protein O205_21510 [Bacillus amyloliquefaciens EGD-AQ14]